MTSGPAIKSVRIKSEGAPLAFEHLKSKVRVASKRDLEPPLPMPFELPRNYPPIVMADLQKNILTSYSRPKFFSHIASAIFKYKSYPLTKELDHVSERIVQKYPFLKNRSGYVSCASYVSCDGVSGVGCMRVLGS